MPAACVLRLPVFAGKKAGGCGFAVPGWQWGAACGCTNKPNPAVAAIFHYSPMASFHGAAPRLFTPNKANPPAVSILRHSTMVSFRRSTARPSATNKPNPARGAARDKYGWDRQLQRSGPAGGVEKTKPIGGGIPRASNRMKTTSISLRVAKPLRGG